MQALEGIRVVDVSQLVSGPYCSMLLGDLGAEVIKVEPPGGDMSRQFGPFLNGESAFFMSVNRNKKGVVLNLQTAEGREILKRLLASADVFLHNFRTGVVEKLGLDFETLAPAMPRLIYCAVSAFGERGPEAHRPGVDLIFQADGGMMSVTGEPDGPPVKVGTNIADVYAATLAAFAIVSALYARGITGRGQKVEVALRDGLVSLQACWAAYFFATGQNPERMGSASPFTVPNECFDTRDRPIAVAIVNDKHWGQLCALLEIPHLAQDPRFATNPARVANRGELLPILRELFLAKSSEEWLRLLDEAGIPCGPIKTYAEVFSTPQLSYNEMVVQIDHPIAGEVTLTGVPVKLQGTPGGVYRPPPTLGQHTEEILRSLGYSAGDMERLRNEQVI